MGSATISIEVDLETARAFIEAPTEERRKIELLLNLRLRELTLGPTRPLKQIMDEIDQEAGKRGLTPEILDSLLQELGPQFHVEERDE
jgi:hypothetical protein